MNNLFFSDNPQRKSYTRDSKGRFSSATSGYIDRLECENRNYRNTIKYLTSVINGYSMRIRQKDEEILKLKR